MNILLCAAGAVLMILGAAELCRLVVFWATKPIEGGRLALLVFPQGAEDCEARWMGGGCGLICVLPEETPELLSICRFLRLRYPEMRVCKREELVYDSIKDENGQEGR